MHNFRFVVASIAMLAAFNTEAADPKLLLTLMERTKFIYIADYEGSADKFTEDADPMTVQIVTLNDSKQGKSHVSDDGQVIFIRAGEENKTERLTQQSLNRRLKNLKPNKTIEPTR